MQHLGQLHKRATDYLREYKEAQISLAAASVSPGILQNWKPPSGQLYKLNFDAATFASKNASGVGAVIRNAARELMAALSAREQQWLIVTRRRH